MHWHLAVLSLDARFTANMHSLPLPGLASSNDIPSLRSSMWESRECVTNTSLAPPPNLFLFLSSSLGALAHTILRIGGFTEVRCHNRCRPRQCVWHRDVINIRKRAGNLEESRGAGRTGSQLKFQWLSLRAVVWRFLDVIEQRMTYATHLSVYNVQTGSEAL